ncbi:MAG: hypothetical protein WCJ55_19935 [Chloroflexales bacterium]
MSMRVLAAALAICILLALAPHRAGAQIQPPAIVQHEDALIPPPPPPSLTDTGSRGPSQYMAGRVAVRVVLPESVGHSEDWSAEQIDQVRTQIQAGLDWWAARMPLARLSFTLRLEVVPSDYEPIEYGVTDEGRWISDTLGHLGFPGANYFDQAYAADAALRDMLGTDWATTIFVVNSSGRSGGVFPDGHFAYAYINGPFMVLTSDVGGYGHDQLAPVAAHEFAHIFGALDQYAAAHVDCAQTSGYLNMPTRNSAYNGCGTHLPSIMIEILDSFSHGQIDPSALAQIGYLDSDADGIIDPLDTLPQLTLDPTRISESDGRPILSGASYDLGFPSPYQPTVSINTISTVEYRVDGGVWQPITIKGTAAEVGASAFAGELPLYDGDYSVEVRARNNVGSESRISGQHISVSQVGSRPDYRPSVPAITADAEVRVQLGAPEGTQAVQISRDPSFSAATWATYMPEMPVSLSGCDGKQTVYVRYRDSAGRESLAFALNIQLDTTPPTGSASRDPNDPGRLIIQAQDVGTSVTEIGLMIDGAIPLWLPFQTNLQLDTISGIASSLSLGNATPMSILFRDAAGNTSAPQAVTSAAFAVYLPLVVR